MINVISFVALIYNNLWGKVSRGSTLLLNHLTFLDDLTHTEITDFNSFFSIKQNIVKLDISVNNTPAMDMGQTIHDLFENELRIAF